MKTNLMRISSLIVVVISLALLGCDDDAVEPEGAAGSAGSVGGSASDGGAASGSGGDAGNGLGGDAGSGLGGSAGSGLGGSAGSGLGGSAGSGSGGDAGSGSGGAGGDAGSGSGAAAGTGSGGEAGSGSGGDGGSGGRTAKALVAGRRHTCAVLQDDSVKCWGGNDYGQLGLGDTKSRGDGRNEMGNNLPPVSLGTGRTAKALVAGGAHTCALLDNDSVKCWGQNGFGQLGLGDGADRGDAASEMGDALPLVSLGAGRTAKALAAGSQHSCALLDDDSVKCWGQNEFGQLGLGDIDARGDTASEVGDGLPALMLGTGRTAKALVAGGEHTCVLLDDASVKCWGNNNLGQVGLGDNRIRGDHPSEMGDFLPVVSLGAARFAQGLAAGYDHTCAFFDDDSSKCWGNNSYGQLGLGDNRIRGWDPADMGDALPAISVGTGRIAQTLIAGDNHTCALLNGNLVKCWGRNEFGQLGLGDTEPRGDAISEIGDGLPTVSLGTGRTARALAAGFSFTCALLDDDSIKCWGRNEFGQLGLGDTKGRGDGAAEMGDALRKVVL